MRNHSILFLLAGVFALTACDSKQIFSYIEQSQEYNQKVIYNNKVDILIVIDTSASMQTHQLELGHQMKSFVDNLVKSKLDFHIAVTTMDLSENSSGIKGGVFIGNPKVMTLKTPNLISVLQSHIVLGQEGSMTERGLASISEALSPEYLASEGRGFLREDTPLSIVVLSNEDDKSTITSQQMIKQLDLVKPPFADGQRSWIFNFIGVLNINGACSTKYGYSDPGLKYMDLVNISGGLSDTICTTDLSNATRNLKMRVLSIIKDFKLKFTPDLETIKVYVDSVLVPRSQENGWDYIEEQNTIHFYGNSIPSADSIIKIDYNPSPGI